MTNQSPTSKLIAETLALAEKKQVELGPDEEFDSDTCAECGYMVQVGPGLDWDNGFDICYSCTASRFDKLCILAPKLAEMLQVACEALRKYERICRKIEKLCQELTDAGEGAKAQKFLDVIYAAEVGRKKALAQIDAMAAKDKEKK